MNVQERNREVLAAVQERRDEFYEGILGLERAIATPTGDDPAEWAVETGAAVVVMRGVLEDHVAETEAPGSFYDDVVEHSPHLIRASQRLRTEHPALLAELDALANNFGNHRRLPRSRRPLK